MLQETSQECILDTEYNNLANNTGKTGLSLMTPGLRLMQLYLLHKTQLSTAAI